MLARHHKWSLANGPPSGDPFLLRQARRSVFDGYTALICRITLIVLFRWRVPERVLIGTAPAAGLLLHRA